MSLIISHQCNHGARVLFLSLSLFQKKNFEIFRWSQHWPCHLIAQQERPGAGHIFSPLVILPAGPLVILNPWAHAQELSVRAGSAFYCFLKLGETEAKEHFVRKTYLWISFCCWIPYKGPKQKCRQNMTDMLSLQLADTRMLVSRCTAINHIAVSACK